MGVDGEEALRRARSAPTCRTLRGSSACGSVPLDLRRVAHVAVLLPVVAVEAGLVEGGAAEGVGGLGPALEEADLLALEVAVEVLDGDLEVGERVGSPRVARGPGAEVAEVVVRPLAPRPRGAVAQGHEPQLAVAARGAGAHVDQRLLAGARVGVEQA